MPDVAWGEFPDGALTDMTHADAMAAAAYFASSVDMLGPIPALAATLAADRATIQARSAARVGGLFVAHGTDTSDC